MRALRAFATTVVLLFASTQCWAPPARPAPRPPPTYKPPSSSDFLKSSPGGFNRDSTILGTGSQLEWPILPEQKRQLELLLERFPEYKEMFKDPRVEDGKKGVEPDALEALNQSGVVAGSVETKRAADGIVESIDLSLSVSGEVSTKSVKVPSWTLFNSDQAITRRRLADVLVDIPVHEPMFFARMPQSLSTADLFPGRLAVRTFSRSSRFADDHVDNFKRLVATKFRPSNSSFFNFVAAPPGERSSRKWEKLNRAYEQTASDLGLQNGGGKAELLDALNNGQQDVIVVVAHGDKTSILLPDGSRLDVNDILELQPLKGGAQPPLVILLSCSTGSAHESALTTFAEALLLRGRATAVIAPARDVVAGRSTQKVFREAVEHAVAGTLDVFIRNLNGPWQTIVHLLNAAFAEKHEA